MIKKLHGASSTLVANPRRKKRNPKRKAHAKRNPSRRKRRNPGMFASSLKRKGRKGHKRHNPRKGHKRRNPLHRKRRNPAMLEIAGVDVGSMAIGSLGAIAVSSAIQGFVASTDFYKTQTGVAKDYHLFDAIAPAAVAAGAAFAYKKSTGQVKEIAKYAFIGSVFLAIQKVVGGKIEDATKGLLAKESPKIEYSSTKAGTPKDASKPDGDKYKQGDTGPDGKTIQGLYLDTVSGRKAVGGMYMPTGMSGMYMPTSGSAAGSVQADMGGLGLFKAKSLYGN